VVWKIRPSVVVLQGEVESSASRSSTCGARSKNATRTRHRQGSQPADDGRPQPPPGL